MPLPQPADQGVVHNASSGLPNTTAQEGWPISPSGQGLIRPGGPGWIGLPAVP